MGGNIQQGRNDHKNYSARTKRFLDERKVFEAHFLLSIRRSLEDPVNVAIAYSLEEFLTVLGKSKRRKSPIHKNEYYQSLELSTITEIKNFAKRLIVEQKKSMKQRLELKS